MSGSPVAAIIVNWKSPQDVLRLVESLLPNVEDGLRFVVLENGSNDGSHEVFSAAFTGLRFAGHVTYVVSETNLGVLWGREPGGGGGIRFRAAAGVGVVPEPGYAPGDAHPAAADRGCRAE
ncbi:MAG TPA: hypothetical protein PJ994_06700 [Tepidiformaceae bacterium]|nr:hypothetical protein [Tepidiformaceae bacterium]